MFSDEHGKASFGYVEYMAEHKDEHTVPIGTIFNIHDILLPLRTDLRLNDMRVKLIFTAIDVDGNQAASGREFCTAAQIKLGVELVEHDWKMVSEAFIMRYT